MFSSSMPPTVRQLAEYTDSQVLPPVELIEFRLERARRGRPRLGQENKKFQDLSEAQEFLRHRKARAYQAALVRFRGDCHNYWAKVEHVFEKTMLVIEDVGIVCSVTPDPI